MFRTSCIFPPQPYRDAVKAYGCQHREDHGLCIHMPSSKKPLQQKTANQHRTDVFARPRYSFSLGLMQASSTPNYLQSYRRSLSHLLVGPLKYMALSTFLSLLGIKRSPEGHAVYPIRVYTPSRAKLLCVFSISQEN